MDDLVPRVITAAHSFAPAWNFRTPRIRCTGSAKEHKEMIRSYIRRLLSEAKTQNSLPLSEQLYLLFEGAIAASQLHGEPWPAEYARQAARRLLTDPSESIAHLRQTPKHQRQRSWKKAG